MEIRQAVLIADEMKPNAFSEELKMQWINQVEGIIQTDVLLLNKAEYITYEHPTDLRRKLLVDAPHDKLYPIYLAAMIDFTHGEYSKYQNTMELFNAYLNEFSCWYADNYAPADGRAVAKGYYVSAYGVAVKNGFQGTEEQWLESLKGEKGDRTEIRFNPETNALEQRHEGEEEWDILMTMTQLQEDVSAEVLEEALRSATAAEEACNAAQTAKNDAEIAAENAGSSATKSETAATAAEVARDAAQTAKSDAVRAAENAGSSATRSETAATAAEVARDAAQTAKSDAVRAAENAGSSATSSETAATAAEDSKREAIAAADRAEQAILANGYAEFDIGEDGHLYLLRTANIADTLDFELKNGRLEVIINE